MLMAIGDDDDELYQLHKELAIFKFIKINRLRCLSHVKKMDKERVLLKLHRP